MPVFSGQQTTHLQQRVVAVSTTPILRATSSAEYSPTTTTTPCTTGTHSGNGTRTTMMSSEQLPTAPFLDRTATAATHQQAPRSYQNQHHNHNQRRNATSLLLPPHSHSHSHSHANTSANTSANVNANANARRTAQQTSLPLNESDDHVLPLSYDSSRSNGNNSNNNDPYHHSDQAPRKPQRSVVRAAESGRGSLLPIRHTTTAKGSLSPTPQQRQHQQQRPVSPKPHQHHHHHQQQQQQQLGRSQSQGLPRTQQDIVGEDNNNNNSNGNGKVVSKVGHLRRRTGGNVSSDDEFDAMATTSASTSNNGDSLYNGRSTGRRKRPGSSVSLNSMGNNSATNTNNHNNHHHHHHHHNNNNYSSGREHPGPNSNYPGGGGGVAVCQKQLILIKLSRMKLGHLLQVVIVLAVVALVYESHHKALFATQQLTQFKDEESLLLLHLQKIEQQSIQLHENLGRLAQAHMENRNNGDNNNNNDGNNNNNNDGANENDDNNKRNDLDDVTGNDREVDFDLIHKQTQQLYQMEEELSHEVQTLQKRIQLSARNHIIREFGEGPVQVVLELGFGNNGNERGHERGHEHGHGHDDPSSSAVHKISILLWHDTPHAAWTWLEQIGNHLWDGAELHWQQGNIIETIPNEDRLADYYYAADRDRSSFGGGSSIGNGGSNGIEFVEQSQHAHQAWTVGVREHPVRTRDGSSSRNALGMYINLQDNSKLHTHEACVGKIIDGFDALQKILEATRSQHKNNGNGNANGNGKDGVGETSSSSSSTVVIRKATAMHYVTKKAGMG